MSWIKMREDLFEDPAILMIAQKLDTRPEHVVGYCHRFWGWVSRNCHADSVTGVTLMSIEQVIGLPGFCEMLVEVGWLEYDDHGDKPVIRIPKFERHLSQGAKSRALAAERKRKSRADCHAENGQMSRSERDKIRTREDKRRDKETLSLTAAPQGDLDLVIKAWTAKRPTEPLAKRQVTKLEALLSDGWEPHRLIQIIKHADAGREFRQVFRDPAASLRAIEDRQRRKLPSFEQFRASRIRASRDAGDPDPDESELKADFEKLTLSGGGVGLQGVSAEV